MIPRIPSHLRASLGVLAIAVLGLSPWTRGADVALLGSLEVDIAPAEAVAAGAQWTLDDLSPLPSGATRSDLAPGHHRVTLARLPGFIEPDPVDALVVGAAARTIALSYSQLPSYYFRAVPPQFVRPGVPLRFVLLATDGGDPDSPPAGTKLTVSADPQPAGPIVVDEASGEVRYTLDPQDRRDFTLTFRPSNGGAAGTVVITPAPELPPEDEVIRFDRPLPDPLTKDYIQIRESVSPTEETFNWIEHAHPRSVSIAGRHLLFQAGSIDPEDLHIRYDGDQDVKEFKLYADTVTFRSPFHLPGARVEIHARELRFEGGGVLDVTPTENPVREPTPVTISDPDLKGRDGAAGLSAAPMTLLIESFHSDPGPTKRIVIRGSAGQDGGEGRDGRNILQPGWPTCGTFQGKLTIYTKCTLANGTVDDECGDRNAHAENAVPAGKPGLGGAGGTLTSTLDLSAFTDNSGGRSGAKGADRVGGTSAGPFDITTFTTLNKPGEPEPCGVVHHATVFGTAGSAGPAPSASAPAGPAGGFAAAADPGSWLHPILVRSTLLFVGDAFLNERMEEARAILDDYRNLIASLKGNLPAGAEHDEFEQIAQGIESLLNRIDSNLDYFGNPVTWVPLLSFEANLAAFEEEVDRAIPILYLAHWVRFAANKAQRTVEASQTAKGRLDEENKDLVVAYAEAQQDLPGLTSEMAALRLKIAQVQADLAALETQLEKRAQENVDDRHKVPFWRKALGVLGAVASVIPLGQPYLGFAGAGLGLLSKFDPDHPLDSLKGTADLFKTVVNLDYTACVKGKAAETKKDPKQEDPVTLKSRMKACAPLLSAAYKEIRGALNETKASKEEVAAELEKLRATDPAFNAAVKELTELNAEKQLLGERLSAVLDRLSKFASSVNENDLAIIKIDQDLSAALDVLDLPTLLFVADMDQRTRDRLLYFQYLMAKAFQFRTLKPYTGNLKLTNLLDRVTALVESQNSTPLLSPDQFEALKAVYLSELDDIAAGILTDLNVNVPARSAPVSFRLTADEIAALNEKGSIEIDLSRKGLFGANEEDLRIVDLVSQDLDVAVHGTLGTTATLRLTFAHSGTSRIVRGGRPFVFTHYRTERVNPITWSTIYDGLSGHHTESHISAAAESLLKTLLGPSASPDIVLYSRPGARATLVLSKEVTADNGVDLEVKGLTIQLTYDFSQSSNAQRALDVEASDGLAPRLLLDRDDIFGRQDGRGLFRRTFTGPDTVRLEAPATHGRFAFDHWEVDGVKPAGGVAAASRTIDVLMDRGHAVRAVFTETGAPAGETFRRGDVDGSGKVDITDAISLLAFLFQGGQAPACPDASDADDSGRVDITDAIGILAFLFQGGAPLAAPGPTACGIDPTPDGLGTCSGPVCR